MMLNSPLSFRRRFFRDLRVTRYKPLTKVDRTFCELIFPYLKYSVLVPFSTSESSSDLTNSAL